MNREIKFRVYNSRGKRMWYMDSKHPIQIQVDDKGNCSWKMHDNDLGSTSFLVSWDSNSKNVLMQYTGMVDKHGKEIYEGDILEWTSCNPFSAGEKRRVKVNYVQARFWCHGTVGVYLAELLANEKCKVIGNIYQNEDMLVTLQGK